MTILDLVQSMQEFYYYSGRPAGCLEKLRLRLTQSSLTGAGTELGNKHSPYDFQYIFMILQNSYVYKEYIQSLKMFQILILGAMKAKKISEIKCKPFFFKSLLCRSTFSCNHYIKGGHFQNGRNPISGNFILKKRQMKNENQKSPFSATSTNVRDHRGKK